MSSLQTYLQRFGQFSSLIPSAPSRNLGTIVVIPCCNEPGLLDSLESLRACIPPTCAVEVIVVINSSEDAAPAAISRNEETLAAASAWATRHNSESFALHLIHAAHLPRKTAGVGLARRIGMDQALLRFDQIGRPDGVIACFDADSICDSNYLTGLESWFAARTEAPGCSIRFAHPLEGPEDPAIYRAITSYELHLRYYVQALRFAGFPAAFHTVGSSMAVRAGAYLKQGGMNKRQAGEDFYFLHKIIPLGNFGELNGTRIVPSPRPSDRVPFGTGRAVAAFLETGEFQSYPFAAFLDLQELFREVPLLFDRAPPQLSPALQAFLDEQNFASALLELRANTRSAASFTRRFFRWFDAFRAMKFIHFARDRYYGPADVAAAAAELLEREAVAHRRDALALLEIYRSIQRVPWKAKSAGGFPLPALESLNSGDQGNGLLGT